MTFDEEEDAGAAVLHERLITAICEDNCFTAVDSSGEHFVHAADAIRTLYKVGVRGGLSAAARATGLPLDRLPNMNAAVIREAIDAAAQVAESEGYAVTDGLPPIGAAGARVAPPPMVGGVAVASAAPVTCKKGSCPNLPAGGLLRDFCSLDCAQEHAVEETLRGAASGEGGLATPPGPHPAPLLDPDRDQMWVFSEPADCSSYGAPFRKGDPVPLDLVGKIIGYRWSGTVLLPGDKPAHVRIIHADTAEEYRGEDLRTIAVKFGADGRRRTTFGDAVSRMSCDEPDGGLVGIEGVRTTHWVLNDMLEHGGNPQLHADWWARQARIPEGDRALHEVEVISKAIDCFATIDQLNLPALTGIEVLVRRLALHKEAHRVSPSAADYSAADHFMGWGNRRTGATIAPALRNSVADKLKDEWMVAKEARKAREEKGLKRAAPKSDPKGGRRTEAGT